MVAPPGLSHGPQGPHGGLPMGVPPEALDEGVEALGFLGGAPSSEMCQEGPLGAEDSATCPGKRWWLSHSGSEVAGWILRPGQEELTRRKRGSRAPGLGGARASLGSGPQEEMGRQVGIGVN